MNNLYLNYLNKELGSIAAQAKRHKIVAQKKYGQNFIYDYSLCEKIVKASILNNNSYILEIGPGTGGLTRAILSANPKHLLVIEKDKFCLSLLEEIEKINNDFHNTKEYQEIRQKSIFQIINGDATLFSLKKINELINYKNNKDNSLEIKLKIIANLPYNIGTLLLTSWLSQLKHIENITIMLQKEVAERIIAPVNSEHYGRLSIICQLLCEVKKLFDVSPKAFYPPPKVTSSIVQLTARAHILSPKLIETIEIITKTAFINRRKMIKSTLAKFHPKAESWLNELNISLSCRPEEISPNSYLLLANRYLNN